MSTDGNTSSRGSTIKGITSYNRSMKRMTLIGFFSCHGQNVVV